MGLIMLTTLSRWNRWGGATLSAGIQRDITKKIDSLMNTSDIIVLIGMRRSGKTTVLFQLMDILENQGISKEAILHVNFEEPSLASALNLDLLDTIYNEYRANICPKGKVYVFFDEIQNGPQWERWVRARNETEQIKIILTGSSANLMSRELGTVLTGRHISFIVSPLSFSEYLHFKQIKQPTVLLPIGASHEINHALEHYLYWGGLPEVVLSESDDRRRYLLKQYFDDLLFKDVSMRHEIRDIALLRNLAVYLLTQTASLISYHRIAKQFGISLDKASSYCSFLQEAFLVDFLPFFSLKTAERKRHPFKVHAVDLGLRTVTALTGSEDKGRLMETAVCHQIKRNDNYSVYYWKGTQEIDFLIREGHVVTQLIQVSQDVSSENVLQRELNAFSEAEIQFSKAETRLIVGKQPKKTEPSITPLWLFLLE